MHPAWRAWTAVAAAYLLVLQMLVVGLATPAFALESAGILCQSAATADSDGSQSPSGTASADCCVLGCPMFGPSVAPPPHLAVVLPGRVWGVAPLRGTALILGEGLGSSTSRARAPPSLV